VNLELGLGPYSDESANLSRRYAAGHGLTLHEVDLATDFGFTIPGAAAASRRNPCSACGLSKRYVLNDFARRGGYDALVMGHNLDDEAATLFSNVMNWNVEYLARQRPVLPAGGNGLVRKVKPLIRVAERETAAYAILRGIDYEIDECPMATGNTINRIKEHLTMVEEQAPGTKQQFLFGFFERAATLFRNESEPDLHACALCDAPTTGEICAFCRLKQRARERTA
jgi:uncharacterized protein (TIGR00269 family)